MSGAAARIVCVLGDITTCEVDAIMNAANEALAGGGGVDGAIHAAAGPALLEACRREHPEGCPTGEARITEGYGLPARFVIHTVGPVWRGGGAGEAELLAACYRSSLALAAERGLKTVASPAVSCGVYGYPIEEAAAVSLRAVSLALDQSEGIERFYFVLSHAEARAAFADALTAIPPA